ncbi:MAG: LysM peptidoglycan-binding domain-containing protein [Candidatus Krumholzibacteriia bacterium]
MRRLALFVCLLWLLWPPAQPSAQEWRIHTVTRGESLTAIARRYDVTVGDLRDWNELRSDGLAIGQKLRIPAADQEFTTVRRGDTLERIARRHDLTVPLLRQLNDLQGDHIRTGERLRVRPAPVDEAVHVVREGDTLTAIAGRHGLTVRQLQAINGLDGDRIYVGQSLRLREAERSVHVVERGDALSEIAEAYGLTVSRLRHMNGLTSDVIHPGQELRIQANGAPPLETYTVRRGDNLTDIARLHQMSLQELRELNGLRGSVIHPGQALRVRPRLGGGDTADVAWDRLELQIPGVRRIPAAHGPYYWERPRADRQQGPRYIEESTISPAVAYRHGLRLWERLQEEIDRHPKLSNRLDGWHVVLDPGHGGIDPGAIVAVRDADGQRHYVVEDEYVYDLALRAAVLLKLHGAAVTLTLLSPNHLLRTNEPASATFVHDRNEVFNDEDWNRRDRPAAWPKGGQTYLDRRVAVARRAFQGTPASRQVFLSFHADNDPTAGDAVTLFYYQDRRRTDTGSRGFARDLLPAMGAGARLKGRSLGVLRDNPARYKLLVEMRNLAYPEHVWALRHAEVRQRDAEKVVRALLEVLADR